MQVKRLHCTHMKNGLIETNLTGGEVGVDCTPVESGVAHKGAGGDIPSRVALHTQLQAFCLCFHASGRTNHFC